LIGGTLLAGAVFAPWAFGTTQPWSIFILNLNGWTLGLLWLAGWSISRRDGPSGSVPAPIRMLRWLTVAILGYELIAVLNAQATYNPIKAAFSPRPHLPWLPSSLDLGASWAQLQRDLALAGAQGRPTPG